jgi:hypothetical protein
VQRQRPLLYQFVHLAFNDVHHFSISKLKVSNSLEFPRDLLAYVAGVVDEMEV